MVESVECTRRDPDPIIGRSTACLVANLVQFPTMYWQGNIWRSCRCAMCRHQCEYFLKMCGFMSQITRESQQSLGLKLEILEKFELEFCRRNRQLNRQCDSCQDNHTKAHHLQFPAVPCTCSVSTYLMSYQGTTLRKCGFCPSWATMKTPQLSKYWSNSQSEKWQ